PHRPPPRLRRRRSCREGIATIQLRVTLRAAPPPAPDRGAGPALAGARRAPRRGREPQCDLRPPDAARRLGARVRLQRLGRRRQPLRRPHGGLRRRPRPSPPPPPPPG